MLRSRATDSSEALSGGNNRATALSLKACPYLATSFFHYRPRVCDSNEATTILTQGGVQALAEPEDARASHRETKADRRRIKELERELRRKDKALAETAALLVLSKKLEVIFHKDRDEDA